ncbi:hypothetical protein [Pseudomonas huaxiensis]|uniref:hypothetical protein n=1 Tax=Pseudomonas huaxiensis TaxID=2213017 RepID=UPI000DA6B12B|nr:hypothetical protein [Pseudomonas huaxiensis]
MLGALLDKVFNRPLTQEGFARTFIKAARDAGFSGPLTYAPDDFRIEHSDGAYFNLHNAFRDYQKAERPHRAAALNGYIATLLRARDTGPRSFEEVRSLLRPVVRNLGMLEEVRLHTVRTEGPDAPYSVAQLPVGKDCVALLAVDSPEATSTLTKGPEEHWGVNMQQAMAIAMDNLRATTADAFDEVVPGLYVGHWGDGYDTSRVLLPDVLQRAPIKGRPVFMIPTTDVLLVAGDKDEEAILHMVEVSQKTMENGRTLSSQVYTYDDQRIVPFPPGNEALEIRRASLERVMLQGAYHMQKELLDKIHEAHQQDLFVATYQLFRQSEDDVRTFSACSWTETVDTLLPRTDRVALVQLREDGTADGRVVEWDDLETHLSEWLEPMDVYPPRYRTLGFATPEQLSRLTPLT